jgi:cyclophilin family peptidyl-prolyl cis-trans isomerase
MRYDEDDGRLQLFIFSIPDFMIQGGDPTGTGRGGSSIYGEKVSPLGKLGRDQDLV